MKHKAMAEVLEKVASMQFLSPSEEAMWIAANVAYRRTKLKQRAMAVAGIAESTQWPCQGWGNDAVLAVAFILNRHDVFTRQNCTILEAMERISPTWTNSLIAIQSELRAEGHLRAGACP